MKAQEIITKVRRQIVEATASFWSDQELLDLFNDAETELNDEIRLLEDRYVTDVVLGQQTYPLPSNWLSTRAIFINLPSSSGTPNWKRLLPTNLEKKAQQNGNFISNDSSTFGTPREYLIWGDELYLDPVSNTSLSSGLVMFFKATPIPLTDPTQDTNMPSSFKDTLTAYMLWQAFEKEHEEGLATKNQAKWVAGVRKSRRYMKKKSGDQEYKLDINSPSGFTLGSSKGFNPFQ